MKRHAKWVFIRVTVADQVEPEVKCGGEGEDERLAQTRTCDLMTGDHRTPRGMCLVGEGLPRHFRSCLKTSGMPAVAC